MELLNLNLLLPASLAIIGWYIVHHFNRKRDRENRQRDLQIEYLIDAYRKMERASNRPREFDNNSELESAIADIQLFGTVHQVQLAEKFAFDIAQKSHASTDELLADLRTELRKELNLIKVEGQVTYLRLN